MIKIRRELVVEIFLFLRTIPEWQNDSTKVKTNSCFIKQKSAEALF